MNLANGSVWPNAYVERPQVVQDKDGNPLALFLGMYESHTSFSISSALCLADAEDSSRRSKLDGYGDSVSWSSRFCAPGQPQSECGPTTACQAGKKGCGCSEIANPPGGCPAPPPPPPSPSPAPLPPPTRLVQYKWVKDEVGGHPGRCLTIAPSDCVATPTRPCALVLGSCAGNGSRWAERKPHITQGESPNAIDVDCNRYATKGAVVKLLGSSPSPVRLTPLKNGGDHSCCGRFGPLRNRPPVLWRLFLDSWRQDGENSEKTAEKRAKMGEIQPNKKSAGRRPICDG